MIIYCLKGNRQSEYFLSKRPFRRMDPATRHEDSKRRMVFSRQYPIYGQAFKINRTGSIHFEQWIPVYLQLLGWSLKTRETNRRKYLPVCTFRVPEKSSYARSMSETTFQTEWSSQCLGFSGVTLVSHSCRGQSGGLYLRTSRQDSYHQWYMG